VAPGALRRRARLRLRLLRGGPRLEQALQVGLLLRRRAELGGVLRGRGRGLRRRLCARPGQPLDHLLLLLGGHLGAPADGRPALDLREPRQRLGLGGRQGVDDLLLRPRLPAVHDVHDLQPARSSQRLVAPIHQHLEKHRLLHLADLDVGLTLRRTGSLRIPNRRLGPPNLTAQLLQHLEGDLPVQDRGIL